MTEGTDGTAEEIIAARAAAERTLASEAAAEAAATALAEKVTAYRAAQKAASDSANGAEKKASEAQKAKVEETLAAVLDLDPTGKALGLDADSAALLLAKGKKGGYGSKLTTMQLQFRLNRVAKAKAALKAAEALADSDSEKTNKIAAAKAAVEKAEAALAASVEKAYANLETKLGDRNAAFTAAKAELVAAQAALASAEKLGADVADKTAQVKAAQERVAAAEAALVKGLAREVSHAEFAAVMTEVSTATSEVKAAQAMPETDATTKEAKAKALAEAEAKLATANAKLAKLLKPETKTPDAPKWYATKGAKVGYANAGLIVISLVLQNMIEGGIEGATTRDLDTEDTRAFGAKLGDAFKAIGSGSRYVASIKALKNVIVADAVRSDDEVVKGFGGRLGDLYKNKPVFATGLTAAVLLDVLFGLSKIDALGKQFAKVPGLKKLV